MRSTSARGHRLWISVLATTLWGFACGAEEAPSDSSGALPTRKVSLADGRVIDVRTQALRVFPASATAVDFLVALAGPERIVALPEQAFDYASLTGDVAAWQRTVRFTNFIAEDAIALSPDLVLADTSQDRGTIESLRSAGIEVVVLPEVRSWPDARATLLSVGSLLELEDRAGVLVRELDLRVEQLRAAPGARGGLRALCYSNFGSGWSAGSRTTMHEQILLAGMHNAAADAGRDGHVQVTFEDLISIDPDLILVSSPLRDGDSSLGDRGGASERLLRSEPSLRNLRAVRLGRIVALPPSLFATGSHSIVRGAEELARAVDDMLAREKIAPESGR